MVTTIGVLSPHNDWMGASLLKTIAWGPLSSQRLGSSLLTTIAWGLYPHNDCMGPSLLTTIGVLSPDNDWGPLSPQRLGSSLLVCKNIMTQKLIMINLRSELWNWIHKTPFFKSDIERSMLYIKTIIVGSGSSFFSGGQYHSKCQSPFRSVICSIVSIDLGGLLNPECTHTSFINSSSFLNL